MDVIARVLCGEDKERGRKEKDDFEKWDFIRSCLVAKQRKKTKIELEKNENLKT